MSPAAVTKDPRGTWRAFAHRFVLIVAAITLSYAFIATRAGMATAKAHELKCGKLVTNQSEDGHGDFFYLADLAENGTSCHEARIVGAGVIARSCYAYYDADFQGCRYKHPVIFGHFQVDGWGCSTRDLKGAAAPRLTCSHARARINALVETGGGD